MYDVIIIGSGPAGMSAAIYAERAKLKTLVLEKNYISGGQVLTTYEVENYPGFPGISGMDLAAKFKAHGEEAGVCVAREEVTELQPQKDRVIVKTNDNVYETKALIAAMGATHRKLGVPGEEEFTGRGVSYCATCDGAFFKNKTVAVVGGGDVALEDAVFLSRLCEKVYVIHRRDTLRGAKSLQEKLARCENVEILWNTRVVEIQGKEMAESLTIQNVNDRKESQLPVNGVFVAVGIKPVSALLDGIVELDEDGYVKAGENGITSHRRIFAAGDIRTKELRQIITAASDGANTINKIVNSII